MKETAVGILFFVFIAILMYFTVVVKGASLVGQESYQIQVLFDDVQYLRKGHPVVFAGQQIGSVEAMQYDPEERKVRVTLGIEGLRIPKKSTYKVVNSTLFGGKAVSIEKPALDTENYVEPGEVLKGTQEKGLLDSIQGVTDRLGTILGRVEDDLVQTIANARKVTENLAEASEKVNEGKGTVSKLINDERMANKLGEVVENLQAITRKINEGKGTIGKLIDDEKMGENIRDITSNVSSITGKIDSGKGTLGRLINDSGVYDNLNKISEKVDVLVTNLVEGKGTLGRLINEDKLYNQVTDIAGNVRTITGDIVEKKGLLGRAVSDEKIGNDFAKTLSNLKEASDNIQSISEKIDTGDGTLANLVNSREFIDLATRTVENLDKTLGKAARTETAVGVAYFFHDRQELTAFKGYLRILPRKTRYFKVGATIFSPSSDGPILFDEQDQDDGELLVFPDVQLAKLFFFNEDDAEKWNDVILTIRVGLIEGAVGGGIDIDFLSNFRLTGEIRNSHADADEFDERVDRLYGQAFLSYRFFKYFRAYAGVNNFIERPGFSFGISAEWFDEDIKTLVSIVGAAN